MLETGSYWSSIRRFYFRRLRSWWKTTPITCGCRNYGLETTTGVFVPTIWYLHCALEDHRWLFVSTFEDKHCYNQRRCNVWSRFKVYRLAGWWCRSCLSPCIYTDLRNSGRSRVFLRCWHNDYDRPATIWTVISWELVFSQLAGSRSCFAPRIRFGNWIVCWPTYSVENSWWPAAHNRAEMKRRCL